MKGKNKNRFFYFLKKNCVLYLRKNIVSLQKSIKRVYMDTVIFGTGLIISILQIMFAKMFIGRFVSLFNFCSYNILFSHKKWRQSIWWLCKNNFDSLAVRNYVLLFADGKPKILPRIFKNVKNHTHISYI